MCASTPVKERVRGLPVHIVDRNALERTTDRDAGVVHEAVERRTRKLLLDP
jgi:hypothetical protein